MAHYQVVLKNGSVMPMDEQMLEQYQKGEWDPLKEQPMTQQEREHFLKAARAYLEKPDNLDE